MHLLLKQSTYKKRTFTKFDLSNLPKYVVRTSCVHDKKKILETSIFKAMTWLDDFIKISQCT